MKRAGKWAVGIVLTAAAAVAALQTVSAPSNGTASEVPQSVSAPVEETVSPVIPAELPPSQSPCGYQWAYHNSPELTKSFDAGVKSLNSEASGRVEYYGEDCVHADGASTFLPMETDFYVRLQVDDLTQEEVFGNWLGQVMEIVTRIPREQLSGNYGFVEFWFEKSESDHIVFRVPIQQYINEAQGKSGAELFHMFYPPP